MEAVCSKDSKEVFNVNSRPDHLFVAFDDDLGEPGRALSGTVVFERNVLDSKEDNKDFTGIKKTIERIALFVHGYESVSWYEGVLQSDEINFEREIVFKTLVLMSNDKNKLDNSSNIISGPSNKDGTSASPPSSFSLSKGVYSFPFVIGLPPDLPGSFHDDGEGIFGKGIPLVFPDISSNLDPSLHASPSSPFPSSSPSSSSPNVPSPPSSFFDRLPKTFASKKSSIRYRATAVVEYSSPDENQVGSGSVSSEPSSWKGRQSSQLSLEKTLDLDIVESFEEELLALPPVHKQVDTRYYWSYGPLIIKATLPYSFGFVGRKIPCHLEIVNSSRKTIVALHTRWDCVTDLRSADMDSVSRPDEAPDQADEVKHTPTEGAEKPPQKHRFCRRFPVSLGRIPISTGKIKPQQFFVRDLEIDILPSFPLSIRHGKFISRWFELVIWAEVATVGPVTFYSNELSFQVAIFKETRYCSDIAFRFPPVVEEYSSPISPEKLEDSNLLLGHEVQHSQQADPLIDLKSADKSEETNTVPEDPPELENKDDSKSTGDNVPKTDV